MNFPEFGFRFVSAVVRASEGKPLNALLVVAALFAVFCHLEVMVETYFFGDRFFHWGDVVFAAVFLYFEVYVVLGCASYNSLTGGG